MDASYSWHPGTGRVVSRWTIPVPLFPDELFSSWLTRAALTQGCDPLVLTGDLWPKWRIWTRDPDRGLSDERLSILAMVSGIEESAFKATSLRPIVSAVTSEPLDDLAIWPWILALGSRNRKRRGGLQYCPSCLREDREPYYRLQWRMAWHTCCSVHRVRLLDRCPHCNAAIEPHQLLAMDGGMAICATCKRDLRTATTLRVGTDALAFQQAADQVVSHGQGQYDINSLPSGKWFALSRYFMTLLRKAALGKSQGLITFVRILGVDTESMTPPLTGLALEILPVQERAVLLIGVWRMLKAGPERFLVAAKAASLTKSSLRERRQLVPPCIEGIIRALPEVSISRKRSKRYDIPKPRSRRAVMRMLARLQRKILVAAR